MVLWCWKIGAAIVVEGVALRSSVLENARMIMFPGGLVAKKKSRTKVHLQNLPVVVPSHEPETFDTP